MTEPLRIPRRRCACSLTPDDSLARVVDREIREGAASRAPRMTLGNFQLAIVKSVYGAEQEEQREALFAALRRAVTHELAARADVVLEDQGNGVVLVHSVAAGRH